MNNPDTSTAAQQLLASASALSVTALRAVEEVCNRFEVLPADQRDIQAFAKDYSGLQRAYLIRELVALDIELLETAGIAVDEERYEALLSDAPLPDSESSSSKQPSSEIPSGFLNTDLQSLLQRPQQERPSSPQFEFGEPIGSGGIGQVWRAFEIRGQRSLAIKTLHHQFLHAPLAVDRFRREAILTGTLQHPGIAPIYDHGELDDGTPFFSMKLVQGQTFHEILNDGDPSQEDLDQHIATFSSVAQTLAYAHSQGVIHRDLKPHNIMVGRFAEVQVMDWGLAKQLDSERQAQPLATEMPTSTSADNAGEPESPSTDLSSAKSLAADAQSDTPAVLSEDTPAFPRQASGAPWDSDLTSLGDIVGTPGYMAPEQARGESTTLDARSDVFGLGAILFQILCQRTLFQGHSRSSVMKNSREANFSEALSCLDELSTTPELVALCRRCLATDPADRPADAGEVATEVQAFQTGVQKRLRAAEIERASTQIRSIETRKRQRWILGLSSVITAVALLSAMLVTRQWRKATRAAKDEAIARQRAESEAETVREINGFFNYALTSGLPEVRGPEVTLRQIIDDLVPELDNKFADRPGVEGNLRRTLGESYRWLGDKNRAEEQLRLAIAAQSRAPNRDQEDFLKTQDRLAGVLRSRGLPEDVIESVDLRTHILEQLEKLHEPNHSSVIRAMNNLTVSYIEQGNFEAAISLAKDALHRIASSPELKEENELPLRISMADITAEQGKWEEAEAMYRDLLSNGNPPRYKQLTMLSNLGKMLYEAERYADAVPELRQAFHGFEELFGIEHPLTLSTLRKLTRALQKAELYDECWELTKESEVRHTNADWFACGQVFEARKLAARALIGLGRMDEAETFLEESVERFKEHRGEDHKYTLLTIEQLEDLQQQIESKP